MDSLSLIYESFSTRLPFLHPLPGTKALTPFAAALPPTLYYVALTLLPPLPSNPLPTVTVIVRNAIALLACTLFLRLPLCYHVPFSVGLTYQLALVGLYGAARILDTFFISLYGWGSIPRRVKYTQLPRTPAPQQDDESYFGLHFLLPKEGDPVTEHARSEDGLPVKWGDRFSWALELELAMRGAGFTWSSADVRHTKKTWRPTVQDRLHSILLHVTPVLLGSWAVIRAIQVKYLAGTAHDSEGEGVFDDLPYPLQAILTGALGAFLLAAFSFGHSAFAILLHTCNPHPLGYFPPLYTKRIWEITSVRCFWSYGWHRLFSRLFLVYGSWPGIWFERQLRQNPTATADVGKVIGAFLSSAFVHSFAAHTVVPRGWPNATGEAWFFSENAIAVVVEEGVKKLVVEGRRSQLQAEEAKNPKNLERWYDDVIGRIWWISVLLFTGRNFARGWTLAGLVREMSFT